jgi:hypothetical protein
MTSLVSSKKVTSPIIRDYHGVPVHISIAIAVFGAMYLTISWNKSHRASYVCAEIWSKQVDHLKGIRIVATCSQQG